MPKKLWIPLVLILGAAPAHAAQNEWISPIGGSTSWGTAANWSDGVPTPDDDLLFGLGRVSSVVIDVADPTVRSITFQGNDSYTLSGDTARTLTLTGNNGTALTATAAATSTEAHDFASSLTLSLPSQLIFFVDVDAAVAIGGPIVGAGGVTKAGVGLLRFGGSGTSTYEGPTVVNAGLLELDNATGVPIPGDLTIGDDDGFVAERVLLQRDNQIPDDATVTIRASGILNLNARLETIGPLVMTGGEILTSTLAADGLLTLASDVTATSSAAGVTPVPRIEGRVSLGAASRTFDVADGPQATDLNIEAIVSGGSTAGLTKAGAGTLVLSGTAANTYTGTTTVNEGTLSLNKPASTSAVPGDLIVGDGTGGADADVVRLQNPGQIGNSADVTVNSSGLLDLDNWNEAIDDLILANGRVDMGPTALLTILGALRATSIGATPAQIDGHLQLDNPLTVEVEDGPSPVDLELQADVQGGSNLIKTGPGTLVLTGSNTYAGTTTVSDGTLLLRAEGSTPLGSNSAGTTVASGAALELQGGITITGEPLILNGTGVLGAGALRNFSGNNTWAGPVTLATDTTIDTADSTTLTIEFAMDGAGNLTKAGPGTLALTRDSSAYTGATTVNAGTLRITSGNALGSTTAGTTIASGATLESTGAVPTSEPLTLNGVGASGAGGVHVAAGDLNLLGPVTLESDTVLSVAAGSKLTLSGVVSGAGSLTKNGAGTLELTGSGNSNTYAGATFVIDGELHLNKLAQAIAVPGNLVIGDADADVETVRQLPFRNEQIADTAVVVLNGTGVWELQPNPTGGARVETICFLVENGGTTAGDASGVTTTCLEPPSPTPTAVASPTVTPTATATVTGTPPTATVTATANPVGATPPGSSPALAVLLLLAAAATSTRRTSKRSANG